MNKVKVLWLSNKPLSWDKEKATGTWLTAMAHALVESGKVDLINISEDKIKSPVRRDIENVKQYIVPFSNRRHKGLPSQKIIRYIQSAVAECNPDIIHVWGTESYWGLLTARKLINGVVLLEIQGIIQTIVKPCIFYGGLTNRELLRTIGIKELIIPKSSLICSRRNSKRWVKYEKEIIEGHQNINTQSEWVRSNLVGINNDATIFKTNIILRKEFYTGDVWEKCKRMLSRPSIFTTASSISAYKGLHVAVRATALLKKLFPEIILKVAGVKNSSWIRTSGYQKWIIKEIDRLDLRSNIEFLGQLTADEIIEQYRICDVVLIPSFVESYGVAMAEAVAFGIPVVASYSAALKEFDVKRNTVYYFSPGDEADCANALRFLISNENNNSIAPNFLKDEIYVNDDEAEFVQLQIKTYNEVYKNCK